jgi:hypothetical protein
MKRFHLQKAVRLFLLLCTPCAVPVTQAQAAQPVKWTAISTTAMAITGDIKSTDTSLTIADHRLELHLVRNLDEEDLKNALILLNKRFIPSIHGALYQISLAANLKLRGSNTLCGKSRTSWVVQIHSPARKTTEHENLYLAFFSGDQEPNLTPSVINTSTGLCGTYWYQAMSR